MPCLAHWRKRLGNLSQIITFQKYFNSLIICWRVPWWKFLPLVILKMLRRSRFSTISGCALWIHRNKSVDFEDCSHIPQVFPWWPAAPWFSGFPEWIHLLAECLGPQLKGSPKPVQHHQHPKVVLAMPSRVLRSIFPANSCEIKSSGFTVPWCSWQSWEAGEEGHSLFSCPPLCSLLWC